MQIENTRKRERIKHIRYKNIQFHRQQLEGSLVAEVRRLAAPTPPPPLPRPER